MVALFNKNLGYLQILQQRNGGEVQENKTIRDPAEVPAEERGMSGACSIVMQTSHHPLHCIESKSLRFVISKNHDQ